MTSGHHSIWKNWCEILRSSAGSSMHFEYGMMQGVLAAEEPCFLQHLTPPPETSAAAAAPWCYTSATVWPDCDLTSRRGVGGVGHGGGWRQVRLAEECGRRRVSVVSEGQITVRIILSLWPWFLSCCDEDGLKFGCFRNKIPFWSRVGFKFFFGWGGRT